MAGYEFVIVGAGVYGAATAWSLAKAGASACVLEEKGIASRASGGPGRRGVRANARDARELPLMRHAYEIWPNLHEVLGSAPFYEPCGQLLLADTPEGLERLRAHAWLQNHNGIESEVLDSAAVRELEPALSGSVLGAVFCPRDGVADHARTTHAYATAAKQAGAEFRSGASVSSVEIQAGRAVAVHVTEHNGGEDRIEAKRGVILLPNSGLPALLPESVVLPIWNACLQVLISRPLDQVPFQHLTGHVSRTVSLKPEGKSRVMISGGWRAAWDPERRIGVPLEANVAANLAQAVAVYPALAGMEVEVADAGHLESFCIDGIPVIDSTPGIDNLWFGAGWCGHGWAIAPVICERLAGWALEGEVAAELLPFSAARFRPA